MTAQPQDDEKKQRQSAESTVEETDASALTLDSDEASRALAREQGDIHRLLDAPFGITRPFTDPATQATWSRLKDEMRDWLARA